MSEYVENYISHYRGAGKKGSGTGEHKIKGELWREVGYKKGMSVLDYGSGWGAMVPEVYDRDKYLGVDIVPQAIDMGSEMFPDCEFRVMEMGKLKTKKFDFVAAMSVFTHVRPGDFDKCMGDVIQALGKKSIALIDILDGQRTDHPFINYIPKEEFISECERLGLRAKYVRDIKWPGYIHSYFICQLLP